MKNKKSKVIAIDGPSGSGKSTIAKIVAKKLNLTYMDTGAMFRAIAYYLFKNQIALDNPQIVEKELEGIDFQYAQSSDVLVAINGEDLTDKIREHIVSTWASKASKLPSVRNYLKDIQRKIAATQPSILEGRDIGTVIFPDAALKFFLVADPAVRAQRRLTQLQQKDPSINYSLEKILTDIEDRDAADAGREIAPLVKAEDAFEIDTTHLSIDEVVDKINDYYQQYKELFL